MDEGKSTTETIENPRLEIVQSDKGRQIAIKPVTPRSIFQMTDSQINNLKVLAQMVATSQLDFIKVDNRAPTPGETFLVFLTGLEMGFEPMTSLAFFDVIQGKVALKPVGMMAKINDSGQLESFSLTADEKSATCTMKRVGLEPHTETFTIEDAQRLGLLEKRGSAYKTQPKTMLKWRVISACARVLFSDIIAGLYMSTDLDESVVPDDAGNIISYPTPEAEPARSDPPKNDSITWDDEAKKWLNELLGKFGFAKENYPWVLEHLEAQPLSGFGATSLGKNALEKRLGALSKEFHKPAQPKVSSLGEGMSNPYVADHVFYRQSGKHTHLEFVAPTPIRAYGRSTEFKKAVGDTYYNANGFEAMQPNQKEPYEIEALEIAWSVKGEGNAKYLQADTFKPVLAEPPSEDLDAWFGEAEPVDFMAEPAKA
jgi:hypothetical protein